jgi:hypothetical protein
MSLEAALEANTAAIRELIEAVKNAAPSVRGTTTADTVTKEIPGKKSQDTTTDAAVASAKPGAASASTPTKSSGAPQLTAWHDKTASIFAELEGEKPTLENVRKAILAINKEIGRAQADAVLARFGAEAVTAKKEGDTVIKRGVDPDQYGDFFELCLEVLAGRTDATEAVTQ